MKFEWVSYEVSHLLPTDWREQVLKVSNNYAVFRDLPNTPLISREECNVGLLHRGRVSGDIVKRELPWLYKAYHTVFLKLASSVIDEDVVCAKDIRYGVVLNVAKGNQMRFECHIDSNPLEGLLFCTDQPDSFGGELVVSNNHDAVGIGEVDANCSMIQPISGKLIFFDAREYPHYVKPLMNNHDIRIVAAMNFYTNSCPESTRPAVINQYLFGQE